MNFILASASPRRKELLKLVVPEFETITSSIDEKLDENLTPEENVTNDSTKVYFSDISDEEIDKWIDTGKAIDKAGAYGIQNEFGVFIEKIEGNYMSVVGLPINKVYEIVKDYI